MRLVFRLSGTLGNYFNCLDGGLFLTSHYSTKHKPFSVSSSLGEIRGIIFMTPVAVPILNDY